MAMTIEGIKAFAKECFSNSRGSHDWEHSLRVYSLCMHVGQVEGADMDVLKIAAYLHDVGRSHQDESKGTICHAEKGAEMATQRLDTLPISPEQKLTDSVETANLRPWRPKSYLMRTNSIP
jgi:uncharacterized protein